MKKTKKLIFISLVMVVALSLSVCLSLFLPKNKKEQLKTEQETQIQTVNNAVHSDIVYAEEDTGASEASMIEKGGIIYVADGTTFTMKGGVFAGHKAKYGGAIYVADGGTFIMEDGVIKDCESEYGGAIYVEDGGVCQINGGEITKNASSTSTIFVEGGGKVRMTDPAIIHDNIKIQATNINIYVDGVLTKTLTKSGTFYTLNEEDMPVSYENCCGYFLNEELTKTVKNDVVDLTNGEVNLYTKTAVITSDVTFELNSDGTCYNLVFPENMDGGIELFAPKTLLTNATDVFVMPREYNNKPITEIKMSICGQTNNLAVKYFYINSVTKKIQQQAFYQNESLINITIPDSVTVIDIKAFAYCHALESIYIPDSVISIGENCFEGAKGLNEILVDENNPVYDSRNGCNMIIETATNTVIQGCNNSDFSLTTGITSISNYAFYYCTGLTSIAIPNSVTSIGVSAFYYCTSLTSITIPNSVTSIGDAAFSYCEDLTNIYIPSSVTKINAASHYNSPFKGCSSTLVIYCGASGKPSGWGEYWNNYNSSSKLTVKWGYTREEYEAEINGGASTTNINIYVDGVLSKTLTPSGTSYTLNEADMPLQYEECCGYFLNEGLTKTVKNNVIELTNGDVNLYTKTASSVSCFVFTEDVLDGVYKIKAVNNSISGVLVIPKEYQGLPVVIAEQDSKGNGAFFNCSNIQQLFLPDLAEITDWAFYYCISLANIVIPDSVEIIGKKAFSCCNITEVTIPNSVIKINEQAFESCYSLVNIELGESVEEIGLMAFSYCPIVKISFPKSVTIIQDEAFSHTSLTSVVIPKNIVEFGMDVFYCCENLEILVFEDGCSFELNTPIRECLSLVAVYIPSSISNVSEYFSEDVNRLAVVCLGVGCNTALWDRDWNDFPTLKTQTNCKLDSSGNILNSNGNILYQIS